MYIAYQLQKAVYIFEHKNYSDLKSYERTVQDNGSRASRPFRKPDAVGIHRIKGDRTKVTTRDPSGIAHTMDADIPLADANP